MLLIYDFQMVTLLHIECINSTKENNKFVSCTYLKHISEDSIKWFNQSLYIEDTDFVLLMNATSSAFVPEDEVIQYFTILIDKFPTSAIGIYV